jgi:hypothetical protein
MKPRALVHEGDRWATWRTTTDRPEEIRGALEARGIAEVYKGDQNQAWDAVLANHCLLRAVGHAADLCFFVQDEKLGTPDALLARRWRQAQRGYVLSEDYYRGRKGAVWVHQDVSYGLFFTEAVSPEQFARAAVHLPRAAALWERFAGELRADGEFQAVMAALGVPLDPAASDASTRLGPPVNAAELAAAFEEQEEARLYYALTKTTGLYGIVPTQNDDVTLSSIPANSPELQELARRLLVGVAARGAMRAAATRAARREVKERARRLAHWAAEFVAVHPDASITDFQVALGRRLTAETFPEDRIPLTRTSQFMRVDPELLDRLAEPEETLHYLLDVALRHPQEFSGAYNEALNCVGFGLQRVKYDSQRGIYQPPFFVEFAPGGPGTPSYRFSLRLEGPRLGRIMLLNETAGSVTLETAGGVASARDLCAALVEGLADRLPVAVVGKAAAFAAELRRWPRALGLPRQGSRYAPMVDFLMAGLQARGALPRQEGLLLRIGLNALDRLDAAPNPRLHLPRFLEGALGAASTPAELARSWRRLAGEAGATLALLQGAEFGQHVHLVRVLALNRHGGNLEEAAAQDPRLRHVVEQLAPDPERRARLVALGRDLPREAARYIDRQLARRSELLAVRRRLRAETPPAVEEERLLVETRLLLIYAAFVRRLWQRAESLPYLNDRPYSLSLYLLFGPEFFRHLCRHVEFDLEYPEVGR